MNTCLVYSWLANRHIFMVAKSTIYKIYLFFIRYYIVCLHSVISYNIIMSEGVLFGLSYAWLAAIAVVLIIIVIGVWYWWSHRTPTEHWAVSRNENVTYNKKAVKELQDRKIQDLNQATDKYNNFMKKANKAALDSLHGYKNILSDIQQMIVKHYTKLAILLNKDYANNMKPYTGYSIPDFNQIIIDSGVSQKYHFMLTKST
jgi:hypothetical protein